jgi:glutamate racemase
MIGVLDSGIGGLAIVRAILKRNPAYDLIYLGDNARASYRHRKADSVSPKVVDSIEFLIRRGANLIILAAEFLPSMAVAADIQAKFDLPVLDTISPVAQRALLVTRRFKIGIMGTRAAVENDVFAHKIAQLNASADVYSVACPLLVPLVEEGWTQKPETASIVKKYLLGLKTRQIDTLLLGCAHYSILKGLIRRKIGRRVHIVDCSVCIADALNQLLLNQPRIERRISKSGRLRVFVSAVTPHNARLAKAVLKQNVTLEACRVN